MTPDRGHILVVAGEDALYIAMTRAEFNRDMGLVIAYEVNFDESKDRLGVYLSGAIGEYWVRADASKTLKATDIKEIKDRVKRSEVGKFQRLLHILLMH